MTGKGLLLGAFILCATAFTASPAALAAGSVNNLEVFTSFWNILFTDPVTGAQGIGSTISNFAYGASTLFNSASDVVMSGVGAAMAGEPILSSLGNALFAPAIGP
ncbi:MAG TPA: hypothetical protein PLO23_08510 [Alphaproteobacteria bacterium]|nr:hypothetical protein [Alphaproteobacteria bacterium]